MQLVHNVLLMMAAIEKHKYGSVLSGCQILRVAE